SLTDVSVSRSRRAHSHHTQLQEGVGAFSAAAPTSTQPAASSASHASSALSAQHAQPRAAAAGAQVYGSESAASGVQDERRVRKREEMELRLKAMNDSIQDLKEGLERVNAGVDEGEQIAIDALQQQHRHSSTRS